MTGAPPRVAGPARRLVLGERLSVWPWVLGATAVLAGLSILRYHLWLATGDDLGLFQQGLWLLLHRGLTAPSTYTGNPILADAAAYVLLPLAPLYALGGVYLLLALQAFAFALGYLCVRGIGRRLGLQDRAAHLVGLIYLVYPTVLGANLFDFHPDAIGVPLLFGLVWAVLERRRALFALLFVAALLVKDTAPILLFGTGLVLVLRRETGWGALTLCAALGAEFVDIHIVIPALAPAGMTQWAVVYGWLGATPGEGLRHLLLHPQWLLAWLPRVRSWEYLAWIFGPLAGVVLTLRGRVLNSWWIPGLLLMQVNLLSPSLSMTTPFNEMSVLGVPFLFAGLLVAVSRRSAATGGGAALRWLAMPAVLLAVFGWHQYRVAWRWRPPHPQVLRSAVREVPPQAPVVAQNFVLPHLADRAQQWQLVALAGGRVPAGTYVLLVPATTSGLAPEQLIARVDAALGQPGQALILSSHAGVIVAKLLRPLGPLAAGGTP